jgi:signal transduction histidine kinase
LKGHEPVKLRVILIVLSLLSFLSVSVAGYLYFSSLYASAFKEEEKEIALQAERTRNNLTAFLSENQKTVKALAGLGEIGRALLRPGGETLAGANALLDKFREALKADVCYLMDNRGRTVASSNRNDADSFVGRNFSFRPYWREAMRGVPATYMALGVASHVRGVYSSHPVSGGAGAAPVGAVVIKSSMERIEEEFRRPFEGIVLLADPDGIIFAANRKDWINRSLKDLSPEDVSRISRTQQFGQGPWEWVGMEIRGGSLAVGKGGEKYLSYRMDVDSYPGWNVIYLRPVVDITRRISDPLVSATAPIVLTLCLLIGVSVFLIYKRASDDIVRRKEAEGALHEAKEELKRYSLGLERQVEERTREITKAREQLKRLSDSIIAGQEKERAAVSRELHDELGQVLTALCLDAAWLKDRLKDRDAEASLRARAMCGLIDTAIGEVRGIATRLRPGVLDTLGLVDALDWFVGDFERRTKLACVFRQGAVPKVDDRVATSMYRIAQEALTNVVRHSAASRVDVALRAEEGVLSLTVEDDGRGFAPEELVESQGLGVVGMRERAELIGGRLDVSSSPGKGTLVRLDIPLEGREGGRA